MLLSSKVWLPDFSRFSCNSLANDINLSKIETKLVFKLINHWIRQYHIKKLIFIVRPQSHFHQLFQHHIHFYHHCFDPMLSTYIRSCYHDNCKTSNTITVPSSSWKRIVSIVYLSQIYIGSFGKLLQEQPECSLETYVEASTHLRSLLLNILKK